MIRPAAAASGPEGLWLTEDRHGVIEITPCAGGNLCGRIAGIGEFKPDGSTPTDVHGVSDCHLVIMPAMKPDGGMWRGDIYDPESGKTYHAQFSVDGEDQLKLRGYIGVPLLGSTQTWTRYQDKVSADCRMSRN